MKEIVNQPNHEVTAQQFPDMLQAAQTIGCHEDSEGAERLYALPDGRTIYTRTKPVADRVSNRSYLLHQFDVTATRVWQRFDDDPGVVSGLYTHVAREIQIAANRLLAEHPIEAAEIRSIGQLGMRQVFTEQQSDGFVDTVPKVRQSA